MKLGKLPVPPFVIAVFLAFPLSGCLSVFAGFTALDWAIIGGGTAVIGAGAEVVSTGVDVRECEQQGACPVFNPAQWTIGTMQPIPNPIVHLHRPTVIHLHRPPKHRHHHPAHVVLIPPDTTPLNNCVAGPYGAPYGCDTSPSSPPQVDVPIIVPPPSVVTPVIEPQSPLPPPAPVPSHNMIWPWAVVAVVGGTGFLWWWWETKRPRKKTPK